MMRTNSVLLLIELQSLLSRCVTPVLVSTKHFVVRAGVRLLGVTGVCCHHMLMCGHRAV